MLTEAIQLVTAGRDLAQDEMRQVIDRMMRGECSDAQIAEFLLALRAKGESVEEVAGAAAAMRQHMVPVRSQRSGILDTCGTGGDGARTFNISTAAAIVTAAAGVPVAKHGNRRITSSTGSADVLTALGVNIEAACSTVERCLDELGLAFCFAPQLHPAMRHVAAARRSLGVPTIFNLLGPLCNPAGAAYQLLGVGRSHKGELISAALQRLGPARAAIVTGRDGLDEVTLAAETEVTLVADGVRETFIWEPEQFGIARQPLTALLAEGPDASAAVIRRVLDGERGPARDIVVLNSAAALWIANSDGDLKTCAERAAEAIDSGRARQLLADLARFTSAN